MQCFLTGSTVGSRGEDGCVNGEEDGSWIPTGEKLERTDLEVGAVHSLSLDDREEQGLSRWAKGRSTGCRGRATEKAVVCVFLLLPVEH